MLASLSRPQISVTTAEQTFSVCTAPLNLNFFFHIPAHTAIQTQTVVSGFPNNWKIRTTESLIEDLKIAVVFLALVANFDFQLLNLT